MSASWPAKRMPAQQPRVFVAGPTFDPGVSQEIRGNFGVDGKRPLSEHERVVAIDGQCAHPPGCLVEAVNDLG